MPFRPRTGSDSNQTIIVNRFSAPGGYDVSSQGYMDPAHEEILSFITPSHIAISRLLVMVFLAAHQHRRLGRQSWCRISFLSQEAWISYLPFIQAHFGADAAFGKITLQHAMQGLSDGTVIRPAFYKTQRNTRKELQIGVESSAYQVSGSSPLLNNAVVYKKWDQLIGLVSAGNGRPLSVSMWVSLNSDANSPLFLRRRRTRRLRGAR